MSLRLAVEEDLPQILAIYNASIPEGKATADTNPVTLEERRQWFLDHQRPERPLWVYEQADQLLGWMSLSDFYGRPAYASTAEISIYLHPEHQGRKLGQQLLDEALQAAKELQLRSLLAFVFAHNEASVRLFRSRGFENWGLLPEVAWIKQHPVSLSILGKKLD
ncbi:phosphinothricin acetyltransferase [Marinospirillum celere]|uniref:Phosphinothricin acetyltransferase n=1 Tax=Marinospirillum celere TaxID=1122252 RepID=A0A1I1HS59_9GAMM|nr:GNAT family N-acetyltransferase [Marinospirillum celere]SFC26927.1 phosphinothricin acetyltransferase [Marinospirillum celere]